ncbi:MAG: 50S ribosomal protein L24e [Thermoplasmata archaeon]|jgi:large subunit ribosomal protein L24e|nr:50S ribosomal protein L24e [Candidatus Thermoplasmatota archaeon]
MTLARNCSFCGVDIEPGTGVLYIRKDGTLLNFCSKKCRVNMLKLKRVSRRTRWTREFHNVKNMKKRASS